MPAPYEKKMLRVAKPAPQLHYSNVRLKVRNIDNQKVTNDEIRVSVQLHNNS
jgi:RNA recognition motif-containing protein